MSTTNILDLNNRIDELEKNSGGGGSADSAKRSDIATEFNTTTAYTAGCFVYHESKLYQFNTDHAAGAWDPTDVVEANVTDQIVSNKSAIDGLTASDIAYGDTTVKDELDVVVEKIGDIYFVENSVTDLAISSAWGNMFMGSNVVDISSLGFNTAPDVISVTLSTTAQPVALCMVAGVTKNVIPVSLVRATSGSVRGKIMLMLKSND